MGKPNPFAENSIEWYWYQSWLGLAVAILALAALIYVWGTSDNRVRGTTLKALAALAFAGTTPLALERIGVGVAVQEGSMAAFSFLGTAGSVVLGMFNFVTRRRAAGAGEAASAPQGATLTGVGAPPAVAPAPEPVGSATMDPGASAEGSGETLVAPEPAAAQPAPPAPAAWIHIRSGPNAGQTMPIGSDVTTIGRAVDNDIVVSDESVSRTHAEIAFRDGRYQFTDAGSAGGTLVGGQAAAETVVLDSGTAIKVGETELVFMQGDAPAPAAAPQAPAGAPPADAAATMITSREPPPPPVMAWLAVTEGPSKGGTCQLSEGDTVIGRDDQAALVVRDSAVSRRHARVTARGPDDIILVDLGSAGGTLVNGQPVGRSLTGSSSLQLGESVLELVTVEAGQAPPVEASAAAETMVGPAPAARASAVLIVRNGPDAGKTFSLNPDEPNLVGRAASADIRLTDPSVSGEHAIITVREDAVAVHDLASSNGTRVDGQVVVPAQLKGGDVIRVGQSEIVLMTPPGA